MKLSVSNIAWAPAHDGLVYDRMALLGFQGLEIAPTRWVNPPPYEPTKREVALAAARSLETPWGFQISSMQSIWYGIQESIFGSLNDRRFLTDYTCSAIDFAVELSCPHIVFGCPRNRNLKHRSERTLAEAFFTRIAEYAETRGVIIGLEANPTSYGTNFLNTTTEAWEFVQEVGSPALMLNLDLGSIVENEESLQDIVKCLPWVSHVHLSEPRLEPLTARPELRTLKDYLKENLYTGWVSLEMRDSGIHQLFSSMKIAAEAFGRPS